MADKEGVVQLAQVYPFLCRVLKQSLVDTIAEERDRKQGGGDPLLVPGERNPAVGLSEAKGPIDQCPLKASRHHFKVLRK
jgi:hypothetical protein